MNEVKELILGMSDDDLIEAVEEKYSNFTHEALEIAKEELNRRKIPFTDKSALYPSDEENDQEDNLEIESPDDKEKRFRKNKETVEKVFSYIFGTIYALGILILTYFQHKPIIDTMKSLVLLGLFIAIASLVWKYMKKDALTEVILFSIFIFLFKVTNNYLVIRETHFDLGRTYACGFAFVNLIKWYIERKKLPLRKIIGLILFFMIFITIDIRFNK
jgi:hypothetical protein